MLLIDDDEALAGMLGEYLERHGFELDWKGDGAEGLRALESPGPPPDVVVLDVMLPDLDGLEILRRIRGSIRSALPVLMLTARGDDTDRIVGLEMGADDYLAKPFNPRELIARLRALVRRQRLAAGHDGSGSAVSTDALEPLDLGRVQIDRGERRVLVEGRPARLTGYQFDLLVVLAENVGRVVSREELRRKALGKAPEPFDRSIDVHISRIRAEIEADPKHPRLLLTVRGKGYVISKQGPRPGHVSRGG